MPLYNYKCPKCLVSEESYCKVEERNIPKFHLCGCAMDRIISLPQMPIIRQSGNEMALNSLNSKDTDYIKPEHKMKALQGTEKPQRVFF